MDLILTRVVFPERSGTATSGHVDAEHRALLIRQDRLDAQDGAVQAAVPQEAEAAGVGRNVATDVARAFRAEVERHHVTLGMEVVGEGFENGAGVGRQDAWGTCARVSWSGRQHDMRSRDETEGGGCAPETSSKSRTWFIPSVERISSS